MLVFPNCKINLGLSVLNKREDGFHNLETIFYPVPLTDVLEITKHKSPSYGTGSTVDLETTGLPVAGNPADNLCVKAYQLLCADFPQINPLAIHLHKVIPMGAGLGGGSADAAFMLLLLNERFQLALSRQQLLNYAARLGSDCPFFIINEPCFATSRGEQLEPIRLDLSGYNLVFVNARIHINTGWAFGQLAKSRSVFHGRVSVKELVLEPVGTWKDRLLNDFEPPVFEAYPTLRQIKQQLYASGAVYASMTGSGSTIFGIFPKDATPVHDFTGADVFTIAAG